MPVTPFQGGGQALLPFRNGRSGVLQHIETVAEPVDDLCCRQGPESYGREFERKWKPIQATAQRRDVGRVGLGHGEVRGNRPGPFDQQVDGVAGRTRWTLGRGRYWQRRHDESDLAGDIERAAAGG